MYLPIGDAAGEGDQVDVGIGQQFVGDLGRIAGDDLEHLRRQSGFVEDVGEQQRRERHFLRGLQHHAIVGGDGRHDLVRHLVHRMVERRDRRDHAQQRIALRIDAALRGRAA